MVSNLSYRGSVVALVSLALVAVAVIYVLRPADGLIIVGVILTFVSSTLALLKSSETHALVNSRIDEFKNLLLESSRLSNVAARAEGIAAGRDAANIRTDQLASHKDPPS